jgi:hypothetical protein
MRQLFVLTLLLSSVSCVPEETGIDLRIPQAPLTLWRYEVEKLDEDTTLVGILDVQNLITGEFEGRTNVTAQERLMQLDSLQGTPDARRATMVHFRNASNAIQFFGNHPLDVFDEMFRKEIFDTLAAGTVDGPEFQRFSDYKPGWMVPFRFVESARYSYEVLKKQRYHLKFRHDLDTLSGYVDMNAFGIFAGLERVSIPFDTATIAYKMKLTLELQFVLQKNREAPMPQHRKTVVMMSWFHPSYGLIRRSREPFALYLPDYPTRFPLVSFPGERWKLIFFLLGAEDSE